MASSCHIGGSGYAAVRLFMGCHTILMREVDPAAMLRLVADAKVTNLFAVPAVLQVHADGAGRLRPKAETAASD